MARIESCEALANEPMLNALHDMHVDKSMSSKTAASKQSTSQLQTDVGLYLI